jgi:hypothetical protein
MDATAHMDLVLPQIAVDLAERAQLGELGEDQMHGRPDLLVRIEDDFAVRQFEVAARHGEDQFPPLGLVELAALEAVAHGG